MTAREAGQAIVSRWRQIESAPSNDSMSAVPDSTSGASLPAAGKPVQESFGLDRLEGAIARR